jgi:hypothetical protein
MGANPPELIELAETSFKAVLDADYHLDDKASRILSAMAFLTAAAGAIFAKAYAPTLPAADLRSKVENALSGVITPGAQSSSAVVDAVIASVQKPTAYIFGWDAALVFFGLYILCVLVSTGFYLAALGPALNKPAFWIKGSGDDIKSRLFYDFIARVNINQWEEYWSNTPVAVLRTSFTQDYVKETWFLAEKAYAKFYWMSFGSIFFRLGLVAFVIFIASLFSANVQVVQVLATTGVILLMSVYAFERLTRPPRPRGKQLFRSWLFWLFAAIALLLIFLPLIVIKTRPATFVLLVLVWGLTLSAYTAFVRAKERDFKPDKWSVASALLALMLLVTLVLSS